VAKMLTNLHDGVASNNTKIYLESVALDTLNGILVAPKTVR